MSVNPSPLGGFATQFFDNNGVILSGGKIYTYAAGTTMPQATYTSLLGNTAHANPIILDSAGRVPGGEIWLTNGLDYKFVIETSTGSLIGSYDNIFGVNANFSATLVLNIATLKAETWPFGRPDVVQLVNNYTAGDAGGFFRWDGASTATDNGGTIIAETATTTGRWLRQFNPARVQPEWFGSASDWPAAIEAAANALPLTATGGAVELTASVYSCARAITILRDHVTIRAVSNWGAELRFTNASNNGVRFNTGGTQIRYNLWLEDVVITSTVTQTSGIAARWDNVVYGGLRRVRLFGDSKLFSGVQFYSCTEITFEDVEASDTQRFILNAYGSNQSTSTLNGKMQGLRFKGYSYLYTPWRTGSPVLGTDGCIQIGTHVEAVFNEGTLIIGGIPTNATGLIISGNAVNRNIAIVMNNCEIEVQSGASARGIHLVNCVDVTFDQGWAGGNNTTGIYIDATAAGVVFGETFEAYINGATPASAIVINGPLTRWYGNIVDYQGTTHTGVSINYSTAIDCSIEGSMASLAVGIAATNIAATTRGQIAVDFGASCTTDMTGLDVPSSLTLANATRQGPGTHLLAGGARNIILNGDFTQWQRGTTIAVTGRVYGPDRWNIQRGAGGITVSQQTGPSPSQYAMRVQRDSGNSNTDDAYFVQDVKTVDTLRFAGRPLVLRIKYQTGANFSGANILYQLNTGTGTNQSVMAGFTGNAVVASGSLPISTSWATVKIPFTPGASATEMAFLGIFRPTGTAGANDWISIAEVEIVEPRGLCPTFDARAVDEEFQRCALYFQALTVQTENGSRNIGFSQRMAATPTVTVSAGAAASITSSGLELSHTSAVTCNITANLEP